MPDCGVHYLWFAFVCFLIRSHPPPPRTGRSGTPALNPPSRHGGQGGGAGGWENGPPCRPPPPPQSNFLPALWLMGPSATRGAFLGPVFTTIFFNSFLFPLQLLVLRQSQQCSLSQLRTLQLQLWLPSQCRHQLRGIQRVKAISIWVCGVWVCCECNLWCAGLLGHCGFWSMVLTCWGPEACIWGLGHSGTWGVEVDAPNGTSNSLP